MEGETTKEECLIDISMEEGHGETRKEDFGK